MSKIKGFLFDIIHLYGKYFCIIAILLSCPALVDNCVVFSKYDILGALLILLLRILYIVGNAFWLSMLFTFILILLNRWQTIIGFIWKTLSIFITFSLSFIDIAIIRLFNSRICPIHFELCELTTERETKEFFLTYYADPQISIILLSLIIALSVALLVGYLLEKKCARYYPAIFITICITILSAISFTTFEFIKEKNTDLHHYSRCYDSYSQFIRQYNEYNSLKHNVEECAVSQHDVVIEGFLNTSSNIIIIVGESYNRHHSSLYGYYLKTNPLLEKQENLYVFDDVIAPLNTTIREFQLFLTMASVDGNDKWFQTPLLPTIMKRAGYKTYFFSNQFPKEEYTSSTYGGQFLNHYVTDSLAFDCRNNMVWKYDNGLVDYMKRTIGLSSNDLNFVIIHLQGQHVLPEQRFPSEFAYFQEHDIKRSDLSVSERKQIANYDNATRYNDYIVKTIFDHFKNDDAIILYFADHGDEANDFRPHIGRSYDLGNGKDVLQNQLDIPFMIYTTSKYTERHPSIVEKIKHVQHYPFMLDDLPHVVLGLAGIKTKWYTAERDLLNNKYNTSRKRLVGGQYDYDQICK